MGDLLSMVLVHPYKWTYYHPTYNWCGNFGAHLVAPEPPGLWWPTAQRFGHRGCLRGGGGKGSNEGMVVEIEVSMHHGNQQASF